MSDNNEIPPNPLSALLTSGKKQNKDRKREADPTLEANQRAHDQVREMLLTPPAVVPDPEPDIAVPPFPVGMRVRYGGTRRLFAGWEMTNILQPDSEYRVELVIGHYSVAMINVQGIKYELLITASSASDWTAIEKHE